MTDEPAPSPSPAAGRPRDRRIDEQVLEATRTSILELGWEQTSLRGIAERAGTSRAAIARRWPSKAHLAIEALLGANPDLQPFQGSDRDAWISAVVDGSFGIYDRADIRAASPGLLATLRDHDDIRTALWEGFTGPAAALVADGDDPDAPDQVDRLLSARAAIVLAGGSAMILSLVATDDPPLRERVKELLRAVIDDAVFGGGAVSGT